MEKGKADRGLTRRVTFRLTEKKWKRLDRLLEQSTHNNVSGLIREALFSGKVRVITYDRTLDKAMEQLSGIRTELHRIGTNVNQVTHRFHTEELPEARLVKALEIAELYRQTDLKVTKLFPLISKLSEKWLPE